jgi:hypothetical protein
MVEDFFPTHRDVKECRKNPAGTIDRMKTLLLAIILAGLLVSACAAEAQVPMEVAETKQPEESLTEEFLDIPTEPLTQAVDQTSTPMPTANTRLKPEDWRDWPVIPEVSQTAREIYQKGIEMGNNPRAFSKVGDCQNLYPYFLGKFDHLNLYEFEYDLSPYLDSIENFKGHFYRDGQAAQFGFTAASPLSQLMADLEYCNPGETPLECELRLTNPTFVLISLEFPFTNRTPQLYGQYIRKIVEYTISQGAVPILATKADNVEEDHSINLTTAQIAYEYDVPLWNWWLAAQPLWNQGIDEYRDGFHISQQAWEERSKTFLMTLDHLWKELR